MNLTALSGPEPTIGPGILAASPGGPPFTLPPAAAVDAKPSNATSTGDTIPFAVSALAIGEPSIGLEDCPPPPPLIDELPPTEILAAQKAATPKRAGSDPAETVTAQTPAFPPPSSPPAGTTIGTSPVSQGEDAVGFDAPKPASSEGDLDPSDAKAPEDHAALVPGAHQPAFHPPVSAERSVHARVRPAVPSATPKDDRVQPAVVSAAFPVDTPPGNIAVAADPFGLKPAEGEPDQIYEVDAGEPQVIHAAVASEPAPTDASPIPLPSAAPFAPPPTARTGHAATEASSQAPGLDRADKSPPASPRAVERRSARASERVASPEQAATPTDAPSVTPADSRAAINRAPPPPDAVASTPQQAAPTAPPPLAQRDAAPAAEPAPRLHLASPRFAEEVGIAIARRPGGLTPGEELVLQIEPANMGRIRVELRFAPDGALEAVLSADHHRVLEQLRAHGGDLHRSLIEAGGRADIAPPRFEARPDTSAGFPATGGQTASGGHGQAGQQQGHGQHPARAATPYPFDPAAPAAPPRLRPMGATGRLDLIA